MTYRPLKAFFVLLKPARAGLFFLTERASGVAFDPDVAHSELMFRESGHTACSMPDNKPPIAIVAGPTSSGKTRTGMLLAEAFNGEIVSADSIQIYRYMDVGSAKPTIGEKSPRNSPYDRRAQSR